MKINIDSNEFGIASLICGAFGIPGDEDENVYKMMDLIDFEAIQAQDWVNYEVDSND